MPSVVDRLAPKKNFLGVSWLRFQVLLVAIAFGVAAVVWALQGQWSPISSLVYTLVAGNAMTFAFALAEPLFTGRRLRDWLLYIALLCPLALLASLLAAVVLSVLLHVPFASRADFVRAQLPFGTLMSFVVGLAMFTFATSRARMEAVNEQLTQQVQVGQQQLQRHASELAAAFEIQSSLLPKTIPQMAGVEISCAWQPAKTVSGDFFDVLVLDEHRLGLCLADVSGKGISAALLTANLQATLRAFAFTEASPAVLCAQLNQTMCGNLPPGRFVTMFYGVLDSRSRTLRYELAGHTPPLLLRGGKAMSLTGGGPVLGLLPTASYTDQVLELTAGDRLIISTDGVTEAANANEEEFGDERLVEAAGMRELAGAHAIRSAVMDAVTRFAEGHFHDDASLMVVLMR